MREEHFCKYCGEKLLVSERKKMSIIEKFLGGKQYNPKTGKLNIVTDFRCPKFSWWKLSGKHTYYSTCDRF